MSENEMIQPEPEWVDVREIEDITFVHDWEKEIGKGLPHPWIRLCARLFDGMFYWVLILAYHWIVEDVYFPLTGFGGNLTFWQIVKCRYLILIVMMVLEPIQLTLFGTTLGKAIFGLKIKGRNGRNLPLEGSIRRTFGLMLYGFALGIPYFMEWRCIKNYLMVRKEEPTDWEKLRRYEIHGRKSLRMIAFILGMLVLIGIDLAGMTLGGRPTHRGNVTPEQFAEDCTRLAHWYGLDPTYAMDAEGIWRDAEGKQSFVNMGPNGRWMRAEGNISYEFILTDGYVTGVNLNYRNRGRDWMDHMTEQKAVATLAMIGQREDISWLEWIYACKMAERQLLQAHAAGVVTEGEFALDLLCVNAHQTLITDGFEYDPDTHFYGYVTTMGRRLYEMNFEIRYTK